MAVAEISGLSSIPRADAAPNFAAALTPVPDPQVGSRKTVYSVTTIERKYSNISWGLALMWDSLLRARGVEKWSFFRVRICLSPLEQKRAVS